MKVLLQVAFAAEVFDTHGAWVDAVWTELLGEPAFGDGFAFEGFDPGAVGVDGEFIHQGAGEEAILAIGGENVKNVEEEGAHGILFEGSFREMNGRIPGDAGQWAPARSARARSGSQTSAARSWSLSGIAGVASRIWSW